VQRTVLAPSRHLDGKRELPGLPAIPFEHDQSILALPALMRYFLTIIVE
jgi:hypothetical protein